MRLSQPRSADDIVALVQELGFLPFFSNRIAGFSIEECCPPELWFADDADGPWEWKGPVAQSGTCVYGKFFGGRVGFVSLDWFSDFANYRRGGYDYDARYEDGLASRKDKEIYDTIVEHGSLLTQELKRLCNYRKGENRGFDSVITRLQMQTYVSIANFETQIDRFGRPYGWGVARYSTPEALFGYDLVTAAYQRKPLESKERLLEHLSKVLPEADERQIMNLIG